MENMGMTLYLGNQKVCPTRTINGGGERYLIQASDESMLPDWYRIYSDGWCEQGGVATIEGNEGYIKEFTFLIPYKNLPALDFNPQGQLTFSDGATGISILTPYYDSFEIYRNNANAYTRYYWETKGFIDLSQLEEQE